MGTPKGKRITLTDEEVQKYAEWYAEEVISGRRPYKVEQELYPNGCPFTYHKKVKEIAKNIIRDRSTDYVSIAKEINLLKLLETYENSTGRDREKNRIKIIEVVNKMLGLDEPDKIDLNGNVEYRFDAE